MSEQQQRKIRRRVKELGRYCRPDNVELTLDGVQGRIEGISPDAFRGSDFFHWVCGNERVTLEIVRCLLNAFPDAARWTGSIGWSPLHCAVQNTNMDPRIVQLLLERWPESVNHQDNILGRLPLHALCTSGDFDDEADAVAILDLLLAAAPLSATLADGDGALPIHLSLRGKLNRSQGSLPASFCKRLIDVDPATLRVQDGDGYLPIHWACCDGTVETVMYMLELYPESIDARDLDGDLTIHWAAHSDGQHKADIVRYLLAKDPTCASKSGSGETLPLHRACEGDCLDSVRILFDAYPEAINVRDGFERTLEVREFLEAQRTYARLAEDSRAMATPDENGWLPLHHALRNNASLGAIKLLIAGNCDALQSSDRQSAFPLHIACEFSTVEVVRHLLGLLDNHLHALDLQSMSTLHYAIRGGNLGAVNCLLEKGAPLVSETNSDGKLPIHLLWESDRIDRNSVEYVEAVWRLLLAHPETVMH